MPIDFTECVPVGSEFRFAVSVMTDSGRLATSTVAEYLEWQARQPVSFTVTNRVIVVTPADRKSDSRRLDRRLHLRLPSNIRRGARIRPGDTVLLVAVRDTAVFAVYPPDAVYRALHAFDARIWEPR
ncbi:hypothetical protein [Nocardia mexicana]|nr:hypothetical protein [Nocardia mexicana]